MADLPSVNAFEIETFRKISKGNADGPVLMLNLNKYRVEAQYPDGQLYKDYRAALDALLLQVGGEILWRTKVLGHVVGNQDIDEALGIRYPSHQAFLNLMSAPGSCENMPSGPLLWSVPTCTGAKRIEHCRSRAFPFLSDGDRYRLASIHAAVRVLLRVLRATAALTSP